MMYRLSITITALFLLLLQASAEDCSYRWTAFCIDGPTLTPSVLDKAHDQLRDWAEPYQVITSIWSNVVQYKIVDNVFAYACVDNVPDAQVFTPSDVDYAFTAMDANCPRYQPSWAIQEKICNKDGDLWKATSKIIGKAWSGTPVCLGKNGGMGDDCFNGQPINVGW